MSRLEAAKMLDKAGITNYGLLRDAPALSMWDVDRDTQALRGALFPITDVLSPGMAAPWGLHHGCQDTGLQRPTGLPILESQRQKLDTCPAIGYTV